MVEDEADASLVQRARTDGRAFGVLYDRYCRPIYAYLYARTGNHAVAEDLTSQTFFQALKAVGRYEERGLPFSGWLYRIAANVLTSHLRRERPHDDVAEVHDLHASDPSPDTVALRLENALQLRTVLQTLPADQRRALELRFGQDLKIKEIAARMERSEGSVKMLLLRGLETLRRLLGDEALEKGGGDGAY